MDKARSEDPLLTLKKAAERIGVHPATMRRWADNGSIKVVLTPGGHRRFPVSEIERLAEGTKRLGPSGLEAHLKNEAISYTRAEIVQHQDEGWMMKIDEAAREVNRELGQRLMGLMMQYLSAEETESPPLLEEARTIGHIYAEGAMKSGLELNEALRATMFFRDNIVETAVLLPEAARLRPEANKRLLRRINTFLNTIQLAIADTYQ